MRRFLYALLLCGCAGGAKPRDHTPPAAAIAAYPASGQAPLKVSFDGTGSRDDVGVTAWLWNFGDGSGGEGKVAEHTYASKGSYLATLTAMDAAGNLGRAQKQITVTAAADDTPPHAAFTAAPQAGVAPLKVHLDAAASTDDTGITAYAWDLGDGARASGGAVDHLFASAGSYTVTLTVADAAGNTDSATLAVAVAAPVNDTVAPQAVLSATPLAGLLPLRVHLDASASSDDVAVTRTQFDDGNGHLLDGPTADVSYAVAGRYTITLTAWDAAGNHSTASAVASAESLPVVPDEHLYDDAVDAPWQDWSWATSYSLAATAPVHSGLHSVRFTPSSWGGIRFHHGGAADAGFDSAGYDRVSIWVHGGGAGGQKLSVAAESGGAWKPDVPLESYLQGGLTAIPASSWAQALVPLAALGISAGGSVGSIAVKDATGGTQPDVYLDDFSIYPVLGDAIAPCAALAPAGAAVARSGSGLLLLGSPWRAAGANVYYLQSDLANAQQFGNATLLQQARESLDVLVCLGMPVVRTWAFNERPAAQDPASIQPAPGTYREQGLQALDQSIAEVKARGLRAIVTLVDNWNYYGGLPTYAQWAGKSHDDFFTDAQMQGFWKAYVAMLLDRANTVTGVRYKDEPAILAWELGNEFRCPSCAGSTRLHDAVAELAAFVKSLAPSQLISDGGEGFDDNPSLWQLSNTYPVNGGQGASFSTLPQIPELDLLSYHVYPSNYGLADADVQEWFVKHQQLASAGGKVAFPGEYGFAAADATRAPKYDAWNGWLYQNGAGSLGLLWQVLPEGVANNDGFGVYYPSDSATLDVLSKWSAAAR